MVLGRLADDGKIPVKLGHGLRDGVANAGDQLNGVLQEFFFQVNIRLNLLRRRDYGFGLVRQIPGFWVDQRNFPLDADGGFRRAFEDFRARCRRIRH